MSGAVSQREVLKEFMRSLKVLPKLIVLDIGEQVTLCLCTLLFIPFPLFLSPPDYTVWELHVDMCSPPFKLDKYVCE